MLLKPITSEKAVKLIEFENTLLFATDRHERKPSIKKQVENLFNVKVDSIRTFIRHNHKYAYIKLKKAYPAIDVATKVGMM